MEKLHKKFSQEKENLLHVGNVLNDEEKNNLGTQPSAVFSNVYITASSSTGLKRRFNEKVCIGYDLVLYPRKPNDINGT